MCERSFLGQKNIDININMQTYAKMKCTIVLQSICYFKTIFSSHTLVNGLGIRSIARHDNDNGVTPAMVCKSKGALCICISSPLCRFPFFLPPNIFYSCPSFPAFDWTLWTNCNCNYWDLFHNGWYPKIVFFMNYDKPWDILRLSFFLNVETPMDFGFI